MTDQPAVPKKSSGRGCLLAVGAVVLLLGLLAFCALPNFMAEQRRVRQGTFEVEALARAEQRWFQAHHTYYSVDAGEPASQQADFAALGFTPHFDAVRLEVVVAKDAPAKATVLGRGALGDDAQTYSFEARLENGGPEPLAVSHQLEYPSR